MVEVLAQGFSLNRPHHRGGGTQDADFYKGFMKGIFTQIFGGDFGGSGGTATPYVDSCWSGRSFCFFFLLAVLWYTQPETVQARRQRQTFRKCK